jgi:orotidine-5'-phosphate decarboxylase
MSSFLIKAAEENQTILCFGIDPSLEKINTGASAGAIEETIGPFFHSIVDKLLDENAIGAIKPNYAFFARYGFDGLYVLKDIIKSYREKIPVIFDAKRGDIGHTAEAYASEVYDFWKADAVTISPYLGEDSVRPFLREHKLAYLLCRTSNPGGADFQELKHDKKFFYEHVAEKAVKWGHCGLVVGATSDAIKRVVKITKGKSVPLLIPGIGAQGGDLDMVLEAVKDDLPIHRINASRSIAYAFQKQGGNPADAAVKEAEKLNKKIRKYFKE